MVSSFFMGWGDFAVSVLSADGLIFVVLAVIRAVRAAALAEHGAFVLVHVVLHGTAGFAVGIVCGGIEIQAVCALGFHCGIRGFRVDMEFFHEGYLLSPCGRGYFMTCSHEIARQVRGCRGIRYRAARLRLYLRAGALTCSRLISFAYLTCGLLINLRLAYVLCFIIRKLR